MQRSCFHVVIIPWPPKMSSVQRMQAVQLTHSQKADGLQEEWDQVDGAGHMQEVVCISWVPDYRCSLGGQKTLGYADMTNMGHMLG